MDCMATREKNTDLDLEKGLTISEEEDQIKNPFSSLKNKAQMLLSKFSFSDNVSSDERVSLPGDASDSGSTKAANKEGQDNNGVIGKESNNDNKINNNNKVGKEKRNNKKAPKPPRPPKAPTLDAADRRLIKELAELARLKRARIERMKALKKMKATKGISSNTTILAMVLIIILLIVIIYHGMESRGTSTKSGGSEMGVGGAMEGGLLSLELFGNPSSSISNTGSPFMADQVADLETEAKLKRFLWM
ncbi:translation initiation factor IF-2-like [Gossypium australe]|uniref:Translation initiation factor IF-2-like n=1 Tax=Gossypium australe TaxID=47621 RepID=A0A5B6UE64_9ROSI|nr:translation initiation factor IF-2-like [Gossypium australe]